MKILWQNEHYPDTLKGGGGTTRTSYVTQLLQRLGHQPVILAKGPAGLPGTEEKVNGVPVIKLSSPRMPTRLWPLWPFLEAHYLRAAMESIGQPFDACFFEDSAYGLSFKRVFPHRPLICRVEGTRKSYVASVPENNGPARTFAERKRAALRQLLLFENELLDRLSWKRSDALTAESEFLKRDLVEMYGVPGNKIFVVPGGVDYTRFANAKPGLEILAEIGKSDEGKVVITSCGRLVPMKNVAYLLRGFAMMKLRSRCVLVLVGDGRERKSLEEQAERLGIGPMVRFMGHVTGVEEFLAVSDVFVLSSTFEPFGFALVEAMAAGLPCVALRPDFLKIRTAMAEHISDGQTGYLVDGTDPADLASKLDLLAADPATRKRMGEAGQIVCKTKYTWESCASRYIDLVQHITDGWKLRGYEQ